MERKQFKQNSIIIVATHKKSDMPQGECYLPLHVGRADNADIGYIGDNTGANISEKNSMYSELTGLYWAWKNLECDYLGLVHYRRHFSSKGFLFRKTHKPIDCILTDDELLRLLDSMTIIVPKKRWYIETIASHYKHTVRDGDIHLAVIRRILSEKYPNCLPAFDGVMNSKSAYMFNMFIMPKNLVDQYCIWLFDILSELESCVDSSQYSAFEKRYIGRMSERLFNVWLVHNKLKIKSIGRIDLWKVNWPKKIAYFIAAKFFGYKYKASF